MQGPLRITNRTRECTEAYVGEGIYVLTGTGDIERITTNKNLYFQKLWIYPGSAVSATTGVLTANANAIWVGKSVGPYSQTPAAVTQAGTLATVQLPAHGLLEGQYVTLSGFTPSAYNQTLTQIKNVSANQFDFEMSTNPNALPTTLGTVKITAYCPDKLNPTDYPISYALPMGQKMRLADIIVTGTTGDGIFYQFT